MAAYPASACVGQGRVEGWTWHSKEQIDAQGWGHVQSFCFEGNLLFEMRRSPLLASVDYIRGEKVTFTVESTMTGTCEAVGLALLGQEGDLQALEVRGFDAPAIDAPAMPMVSNRDPRELAGLRVDGILSTPRDLVIQQHWGQVASHEFAGEVAFNLSDSPGFSYMVFDRGDSVSFELVLNPEYNMVQARHLRIVRPQGTSGAPAEQSWEGNESGDVSSRKKRNRANAGLDLDDTSGPRILPLPLYTSPDSAEVKMDLVYAALEDLLANHNEAQTGWTMLQMIRQLIREADALFCEDDFTRTALAKKLNGHPWFRANEQSVRFESKRRQLNVAKVISWNPENAPLCWFWKEGLCKKNQCPFRHALNQDEQVNGVKTGEAELCWYWKEGKCTKGDTCPFRHCLTPEEQRDGVAVNNARSWEPALCYFWKDNKCNKGALCTFRHYYTEEEASTLHLGTGAVGMMQPAGSQARLPHTGFPAAPPGFAVTGGQNAMAQFDPSLIAQMDPSVFQALMGFGTTPLPA